MAVAALHELVRTVRRAATIANLTMLATVTVTQEARWCTAAAADAIVTIFSAVLLKLHIAFAAPSCTQTDGDGHHSSAM